MFASIGFFLRRRARGLATCSLLLAAGCTETTSEIVEEKVVPGATHEVQAAPPSNEVPPEPLPEGLAPAAKQLLGKLGNSVWHGSGLRDGRKRKTQLHFRASRLQWAEVQNPFGPARSRELRTFTVTDDASSLHSTVTNPATWLDATASGHDADVHLEVVEGSPRHLKVTTNGVTEDLVEGAEPAPTAGVTAIVHTFASAGIVDEAFCRASSFESVDYLTMFNFARFGRLRSAERELGKDFAVGVPLGAWLDASGQNRFSVGDLPGFDRDSGTELTDQQNFFVYYTGRLHHPGGAFAMREIDDTVTGGVWAFLGPEVGSALQKDVFLEVHDRVWWDTTSDAPSRTMGAGKVPFEVIIARCGSTIRPVTVQGKVGADAWKTFDVLLTEPVVPVDLLSSPF